MAKKDPRIDAYIEKAQQLARPILKHLRKVVHIGSPDVVETIKWSFQHFDAHGSVVASMAAFKQHCAFGFWKGSTRESRRALVFAHGGGEGGCERAKSAALKTSRSTS
jgi:hypothetical protein